MKLHPYAITPPAGQNGRWQTCYKDEKGKRKNIKAQSKEELLDKLIPIYFANSHIDNLTFYGLYEEWLAYKVTVTNSSNTIKRHKQHYRKYFEPSVLHNMTDRSSRKQAGQRLTIVREEVRNQETNPYEVVEHTKTNRDRFVIFIPKAVSILEKIPKQGKYIFMRDGERITSRQIAYVLEKFAERQGVRTKSTHKMRKTYASNLNANGVPLDCIREMLGHSNLSTTLEYIYNPLTEKETYDLISKAL